MRDNGQVTQKEFMLANDTTIVSKTDLHGNITSANEAFIEASGYEWSELVGQPHNILRHPDVPPAVFKDLWQTLQAGKPWSQIVKNRRKNGDHYWVVANATPIFENGEMTGYMSVRKPASNQQKQEAEQAYQAVANGQLKLRNGNPASLLDRFNPILQLNQTAVTVVLSVLLLISAFTPLIFPSIEAVIPTLAFEIIDIILVILLISMSVLYGQRLKLISKKITDIAEGKFDNGIDTRGSNLISKVFSRLKSMQIKLGADMDDFKYNLANAQRIENALSASSSSVMVADRFRSIIFMNQSIQEMLGEIEDEIKQLLPNFDSKELLHKSIDIFHQNPDHQAELLDNLTETYKTRIEIGSITIDLIIDPIFDDNGQRIGTVAEWKNMTEQIAIERDIAVIIEDAAHGVLTDRIETAGLSGFEKRISIAINDLLNNFSEITQNLNQLLDSMANNDLTQRLEGDYQAELLAMQNAANKAMGNFGTTLSQVNSVAHEIGGMAKEVAVASEDLSQRTQSQAASLEETAASMEQITSTIQHSTENTMQANKLVHSTVEQTAGGIEVMNNTLTAMKGISDLSKQIGEITTVIDSIAFQTNLLALNAAVEAARAGEHGRGFAVVAGEVRNLAGKSAEAAKDISSLIDTTIHKIEDGTNLVERTNTAFESMAKSIKDVEVLIDQVSTTSSEQAEGIRQINIAVTQIDEITQQNAALVEQLSATAGNMSDESANQVEFIKQFKFDKNSATPTVSRSISDKKADTKIPAAQPQALTQPKTEQPASSASKQNETCPVSSGEFDETKTDNADEWSEF